MARAIDAVSRGDDAHFDRTLRPRTFTEYIGQTKHKENLRVLVEAAKRREEPLDHILLTGPPGLGKTPLAHILAHEMGVQLVTTSGPVIEHKGALAALLTTKLSKNDILFIDEIHRLNPVVEESLYPALDDLVIDLPPGTGDAQLTLTQKIRLSGAVIVTTPQDVSLIDARKGLAMFQKVNVPVLGIVENMSYYLCPKCGHREEIFKHGGGRRTAEQLHVPFLGEIPLDTRVAIGGDAGRPIVAGEPKSEVTESYLRIAEQVARAVRES